MPGRGHFACRRLIRKQKKLDEEKKLLKFSSHPLRRPQLLQVRRGGRRPRRSVSKAVSYQSRDGCIDIGPAWFLKGGKGERRGMVP